MSLYYICVFYRLEWGHLNLFVREILMNLFCVRDSDSYFYHCKVILCTLESLVSVNVIVIILMIIEYDFLFMLVTSFSTN
jgi:hypothetical protein